MTILEIKQIGDPILRSESLPVKEVDNKIRKNIEDMFETMYHSKGVGLSAPQVGILKRFFVANCSLSNKQPEIFINPKIIKKSKEETLYLESCLSIPKTSKSFWRPLEITVEAFDLDMNQFTKSYTGLSSRIIQHEIDHLDGILITDYPNISQFASDQAMAEIVCPKCRAQKGHDCKTPSGKKYRDGPHYERRLAYINKIGMEEFNRRHSVVPF